MTTTHFLRTACGTLFFLCIPLLNAGQVSPNHESDLEDLLSSPHHIPYEDLSEDPSHTVMINTCSEDDLRRYPFLLESHITAIVTHRRLYGPFVSPFELQAVKGLPRDVARLLAPHIDCTNPFPLPQSVRNGISAGGMVAVRVARSFTLPADTPGYIGSPWSVSVRSRFDVSRHLVVGLGLEKDSGEPFLWKGRYNQGPVQRLTGFDNAGISMFIRDLHRRFPVVLVGSYALSLGQGLLLWQGYPAGKSAMTLHVRKLAPELRPVFSPAEGQHMKGIGFTLRLTARLTMTPFASIRKMDATITTDSLSDTAVGSHFISAFDMDGYHRTQTEMQGRHAIRNTQYGTRVAFTGSRLNVGINLLCTRLSLPLLREPALYRQFSFEGQRLYQASVDYSLSVGGYTVFGEHAVSRNGATAHTAGVQKSLHPKLDMAWVLRSFARDYHTLTGSALAESSLPVNECGSYLGVEWRPALSFLINTYADLWHHPWPGYQRSAPAMGRDMLLRILWRKKRKADIYIQWKMETEQKDEPGGKTATLQSHTTQRLRGHAQFTLAPGWQWRCRAEWSWYVTGQVKKGFLLFQDVIYKPMESPWSITARLAFFDIDDFDARIYSYEHDVLFTSSIPFVQGQGTRCNLLIRRTIARKGRAELRWSVTRRRLPKEDAYHSGRGDTVEQHLTLQWSWRW